MPARHDSISVQLGDRRVAVRVTESARLRSTRIVVLPSGRVDVVSPRRMTAAAAALLLEHHRTWIERRLARARPAARALMLDRAGIAVLAGQPVRVRHEPGRPPGARLDREGIVIGGARRSAGRALERWYRREAGRRLDPLVAMCARRLGVRPARLAVRDPWTRWGSCSSTGTLSFSWRLVIPPGDVLEYIVAHELCHLIELNHSRRFWRALDAAHPGWQGPAGWLRAHGDELRGYDPADSLPP